MCSSLRSIFLTLALLCWASPALAWTETKIQSHVVTLDVARNGDAVVSHELVLRIRGKALTSFTLEGADREARPLPNAVALLLSNTSRSTPLEMESSSDGRIVLTPEAEVEGRSADAAIKEILDSVEIPGND